jgi:hypothetical protein
MTWVALTRWIRGHRTAAALVVCGVGLVVLAGARLSAAGGDHVRAVPLPSAAQIDKLRSIALAASARAGEKHPTHGFAVPTTRKQINRLNAGAEVGSDEDVYTVALHGDFVAEYAHVPPGADLPRGHLMILVVDAKTMDVLDFMLGDAPIDPTRLGTPVSLGF